MSIELEKPVIKATPHKPMALANKPFPYSDLANDRRFEEFVYSLFHSEIMNNKYGGFDNIQLMTGSHDLGQDCALLRNGKHHGVIQCKLSRNAYSVALFGKEIVKFVLYSLIHEELIYDPDDFTYYLAVSYGLERKCLDLIGDFKTRITTEPKLEKWIIDNLKLPTLQILQLQGVKPKVIAILEKIKVKLLNPILLDSLLIKQENEHLIPLFFEVRTVGVRAIARLTEAEILDSLTTASIAVKSQKNEFDGISESHIPRAETQALLQWVKADAPKDKQGQEQNICLLAANPGMGKTVIIKDLYDALIEENIPVLALKADQVYASSLKGLEEKISLGVPLHDFIEQCIEHFTKTVILVDQIDALSQSMSADRSFINTYTHFIAKYIHNESVRIIISVRLFDLYFDPSLKLYHNLKKFEVKKLDANVVLSVIEKLGIGRERISNNLLNLLCTPNNLDIFSRIYAGKTQFAGINTIVDLYNELWNVKILGREERLPQLVYEIAEEMHNTQQITVSESKFEVDANLLVYLKAERIVQSEKNGLQFFHQSFYDYAFARRFVHGSEKLSDYLMRQEQSLFARSAVKMILNHLRSYDIAAYIVQATNLLTGKRYLFHIQHLVISFIAVQDAPLSEEKTLVSSIILARRSFAQVFFDQVFGKEWTEFLLHERYLNRLTSADPPPRRFQRIKHPVSTKNENLTTLFHILRKNLNNSPDSVIDFINGLDDWQSFARLLFGLADWSNTKGLAFLDRIAKEDKDRDSGFQGLLAQITETNPDYVFESVKGDFFIKDEGIPHHTVDREHRVFEALFRMIPFKVCEYAIATIDKELPEKLLPGHGRSLKDDYFIHKFDLAETESLHHHDEFYNQFGQQMQKYAAEKAPIFTTYLAKHQRSPYRSIIKLLVFCLSGNESLYPRDIYSLIIYLNEEKIFNQFGRLNYDVRRLIGAVYQFLSPEEQADIRGMIKNLRVPRELIKWPHGGRQINSQWGLTKLYFLQALPQEVIVADHELKKIHQELLRRHGDKKEARPHHGVMISGGAPPLERGAYVYMKEADWLRTFRKYNRNYDDFSNRSNGNKFGGMYEHATAFKTEVAAAPGKLIPLIGQIISDTSIDFTYARSGVEGLALGSYDDAKTIPLFMKLVKRDHSDDNLMVLNLGEKLMRWDNVDEGLLDYVIWQALHNPDPEENEVRTRVNEPKSSLDKYVQGGINTVRGFAAHMLVRVTDQRYKDKIFEAIEIVFDKDNITVRAAVMYQFAFLMNLDGKRAFELFLKIVSDKKHKDIMACTLWTLQYLTNYDYRALIPHLQELSASDELLMEDIRWLSTILFSACYHGYKGADKLFDNFFKRRPEAWQHAAHDAIGHFYKDGKKVPKSYDVLKFVFSAKKTAKLKGKDFHVYDLEQIKFNDIAPLLKLFVKSPLYVLRESFIEYLTANAGASPLAAIKLFEKAIAHEQSENENDYFFGQEGLATQFILGAYTALKKEHMRYKRRLLKAFDQVLLDPRFRANADSMLERALS